jgi:hypothetical protein
MRRFAAEGSSYEWNAELNGHRIDETRTDSAFLLLVPGDPSGGITNFFLTFPAGTTPLLLDYDDFHPPPPKPAGMLSLWTGRLHLWKPLAMTPTKAQDGSVGQDTASWQESDLQLQLSRPEFYH